MLEYQYRCPACRHLFVTFSRTEIPPCPVCQHQHTDRQYVFQARGAMPDHMNVATGQYVTNRIQLSDALKRMGDGQYERTGITSDYQYMTPAEMRDPSIHGVTEEGLDSQEREWHSAKN